MFENLQFGESRGTIEKKLSNNKRIKTPKSTVFGNVGSNYTIIQKYDGLSYTIHLDWSDNNTLSSLDLYSSPSSYNNLSQAYQNLATVLTEIYGSPKFKNPLPKEHTIPGSDGINYGAVWFYGKHAAMVGIGKHKGKAILVVSFKDKQPKLQRTSR